MSTTEPVEDVERLRYPIGPFQPKPELSPVERGELIDAIAALPAQLRAAVDGLSVDQLDTPYRPGGWTVRQVANHVPDSHLNAYIRFKLAATEDDPRITGYDEAAWAGLEDGRDGDVGTSLALLEALHERWVRFLRSLEPEAFARTFQHPELGSVTLDRNLQLYAWHGRHHVAHVASLREREGW